MEHYMEIEFNTEIWKEGDMYVAYISQLDLSSCGKTVKEAKKNIKEAMTAFIEEAHKMGTLQQILEESGFILDKEWHAPEIISFEKIKLAV
jgi:predicted RNase H-like HicB family nuclease